MITVRYYTAPDGHAPFGYWLQALKDKTGANAILARISRIAIAGYFGDHKRLAGHAGLFELRIHSGPGYRVYYGLDGGELVIVLAGGLKREQDRDIRRAARYWKDYLISKRE